MGGGGLNKNYAKVGHYRVGAGSHNLILNFGISRISRAFEATELKFSVPMDGWGPYENYATVGPM